MEWEAIAFQNAARRRKATPGGPKARKQASPASEERAPPWVERGKKSKNPSPKSKPHRGEKTDVRDPTQSSAGRGCLALSGLAWLRRVTQGDARFASLALGWLAVGPLALPTDRQSLHAGSTVSSRSQALFRVRKLPRKSRKAFSLALPLVPWVSKRKKYFNNHSRNVLIGPSQNRERILERLAVDHRRGRA